MIDYVDNQRLDGVGGNQEVSKNRIINIIFLHFILHDCHSTSATNIILFSCFYSIESLVT